MSESVYQRLLGFIADKKRMRMSHIYQPVMLMTLLRNGGRASVWQIAKEFLDHDDSQIEYYCGITDRMPGRVLGKNHGFVEKYRDSYRLLGYEAFTPEQIDALHQACGRRLSEYLEKRGPAIYDHRRKSQLQLPGAARYRALKQARFRCEACGASADDCALDVISLVPGGRAGGGEASARRQVLCHNCAHLSDKDIKSGYREILEADARKMKGCGFCELRHRRAIAENRLAMALLDLNPATKHHTLILPKRHVSSYFELGRPETSACHTLLEEAQERILGLDDSVTGFNIGVNVGKDAGQTVFHCHIHLIPRRKGDVENPAGGIRGLIPGKQAY